MFKIVIVAVSLFIGIMFQNCSDVKFADSKNIAGKLQADPNQGTLGDGGPVVPEPTNTLPPETMPPTDDIAKTPVDSKTPEVNKPPKSDGRTCKREDDDEANDDKDDSYEHHDLKDTCKEFAPGVFEANSSLTADKELNNVRGSELLTSALRTFKANNVRGSISVNFTSILTQVNNHRGDLCVGFSSGGSINNTRGNIMFVGVMDSPNQRAKLNLINNHRGNIYLKNVDVEMVSNVRGTIILENASIIQSNNVGEVKEVAP